MNDSNFRKAALTMLHQDKSGRPIEVAAIMWLLISATTFLCEQTRAEDDGVLPGIDVLQRHEFAELAGKQVGLITNHTGRSRDGVSTVQLLHDAPNVNLVALFSPEHGFEGKLDVSKINDATEQSTGLRIFSLYGETRRPTKELLDGLDVLVFDIQDIGCRFYTYVSTMGEAMKASAQHNVTFMVLDRPNPIGGRDVAGPMLDPGRESFVGFHSLPVRHGMTVGELAAMFRSELKLDLDLQVVRCEGWKRSRFWDDTGLLWVNPSPNMRSLTQALLYPGIGVIEFTNVSVGRGTDTPFEVIGAPWITARDFAAALNRNRPEGVSFVPIKFTPDASKFKGERCGGVNIVVTNRTTFEPLRTGFLIAATLRQLYPHEWEADKMLRLLGNESTLKAITDGNTPAEIEHVAEHGMAQFRDRRAGFLMYE
ncbi:MAG: DUF1343 domain-containing protein [Planctomycetaceae bacterium]